MEKQGIIEKVDHSDWAAPIVAVPKKDGRFRICGDYKVTVNPVLEVNQYPLPKLDDLFATLSKGVVFSKLDLSQAYLHYQLYEESSKYGTYHSSRPLQVHKVTFWSCISPSIIPETHGHISTRNSRSYLLY